MIYVNLEKDYEQNLIDKELAQEEYEKQQEELLLQQKKEKKKF